MDSIYNENAMIDRRIVRKELHFAPSRFPGQSIHETVFSLISQCPSFKLYILDKTKLSSKTYIKGNLSK